MLREEKRVYVLRKAHVRPKQIPVVWYASEYHIRLADVLARHGQPQPFGVGLAFQERKGTKPYSVGQTPIQATGVSEEIFHYPRSSRTADHEKYVFLGTGGSSRIPEEFKTYEQVGSWRIHPREFVDENDFASRW